MTQIDPMLAQDKDKPLNQGFICSKHKVGYIKQCPTCAHEKKDGSRVKRSFLATVTHIGYVKHVILEMRGET